MTINTLKINTKIQPNIVNNQDLEKRVFKTLIGMFLVLFLAYIYFVGHTIFDIVARKSIDTEARNLTSNVSSLELEYFSLSNKIDLAYAKSSGFINPNETAFADKTNLATTKAIAINASSHKN